MNKFKIGWMTRLRHSCLSVGEGDPISPTVLNMRGGGGNLNLWIFEAVVGFNKIPQPAIGAATKKR